jgi:hypothetical protein
MAMQLDRIRRVCAYYKNVLKARHPGLHPAEHPHLLINMQMPSPLDHRRAAEHMLSMIERLEGLIAEDRREKVMRWYAFIQGAFWGLGIATVDELKEHSRPDVEPPG